MLWKENGITTRLTSQAMYHGSRSTPDLAATGPDLELSPPKLSVS